MINNLIEITNNIEKIIKILLIFYKHLNSFKLPIYKFRKNFEVIFISKNQNTFFALLLNILTIKLTHIYIHLQLNSKHMHTHSQTYTLIHI